MIINSSSIGMGSSRKYETKQKQTSYLQAWDNSSGTRLTLINGAANNYVSEEEDEGQMISSVGKLLCNLTEEQDKTKMQAQARKNMISQPDESDDKTDIGEVEDAEELTAYAADAETEDTVENSNQEGFVSFSKEEGAEETSSLTATKSAGETSLEQLTIKIRQQVIDYLLYILFGKDIPSDSQLQNLSSSSEETADNYDSAGLSLQNFYSTEGEENTTEYSSLGGEYYNYYEYSEKEATTYESTGTVVTSDGREINFNISLSMSRSFYQASSQYISFGQEKCCDPLVINLDANVASVEDQKFYFDLDSDGNEEYISRLSSGSGYLALDKNGDGAINDGSELFGTTSGDGFADLSQYDEDQNGWIDEADEIFDKLLIWQMDEAGGSSLVGLGKAGVGAIYLGAENTEFALKDGDNNTDAVIRKTGIFAYENGGIGTMNQLDLAT